MTTLNFLKRHIQFYFVLSCYIAVYCLSRTICVVGQPYNQLAILEASRGDKLSTVFYYVRSLAVRHPFPVAATNLEKFYSKLVKDGYVLTYLTKPTAFRYQVVNHVFACSSYLFFEGKTFQFISVICNIVL